MLRSNTQSVNRQSTQSNSPFPTGKQGTRPFGNPLMDTVTGAVNSFCGVSKTVMGKVVAPTCVETEEGETAMLKSGRRRPGAAAARDKTNRYTENGGKHSVRHPTSLFHVPASNRFLASADTNTGFHGYGWGDLGPNRRIRFIRSARMLAFALAGGNVVGAAVLRASSEEAAELSTRL